MTKEGEKRRKIRNKEDEKEEQKHGISRDREEGNRGRREGGVKEERGSRGC